MSISLRIAGTPARNFVRDASGMAALEPREGRHALLRSISPLRSAADENANISAELDNAGGEVSALYAARPPVGAVATIYSDSAAVFSGVVQSISFSADVCRIEIEA